MIFLVYRGVLVYSQVNPPFSANSPGHSRLPHPQPRPTWIPFEQSPTAPGFQREISPVVVFSPKTSGRMKLHSGKKTGKARVKWHVADINEDQFFESFAQSLVCQEWFFGLVIIPGSSRHLQKFCLDCHVLGR